MVTYILAFTLKAKKQQKNPNRIQEEVVPFVQTCAHSHEPNYRVVEAQAAAGDRTHSATELSRLSGQCEYCHGLLSTERGFGWRGL